MGASAKADRAATPTGPSPSVSGIAGIPCALAALDEWCKRRAARVSAQATAHLNKGLPLSAPNYRTMLGEHRAYMAVRSYIHGSLRDSDTRPKDGDAKQDSTRE